MKMKKRIIRITISENQNWDDEEVNELIQNYEVKKEDIISITHEDGLIYLYYFI
jgi:DNA-directed RNA polymerase subunit H (RpoH/RPB5)